MYTESCGVIVPKHSFVEVMQPVCATATYSPTGVAAWQMFDSLGYPCVRSFKGACVTESSIALGFEIFRSVQVFGPNKARMRLIT
jgi:hypothetical protein